MKSFDNYITIEKKIKKKKESIPPGEWFWLSFSFSVVITPDKKKKIKKISDLVEIPEGDCENGNLNSSLK